MCLGHSSNAIATSFVKAPLLAGASSPEHLLRGVGETASHLTDVSWPSRPPSGFMLFYSTPGSLVMSLALLESDSRNSDAVVTYKFH